MRRYLLIAVFSASLANASPYHHGRHLFADLRHAPILATRSTALLGDLASGTSGTLTASGSQISGILTGTNSAIDNNPSDYNPPDDMNSSKCSQDDCCKWNKIVSNMKSSFQGDQGCTSLARGAIRLGFHDAAAWDTSLNSGGADGSVVLSSEEAARSENRAMRDIIAQMQTWYDQYKDTGISMADLIQMGATTATVVCPGGPRIKSYVGRRDNSQAAPPNLIPSPFSDAQTNIALFEAKSFAAADLVALVGAHTVSQQFLVDPSQAGKSQDTTDGIWDNKFYGQVTSSDTPDSVFKFPSDISLSNSSETQGLWDTFANNQDAWAQAFAPAYFRMSLLGVDNLNDLTDCTHVLPKASGYYNNKR